MQGYIPVYEALPVALVGTMRPVSMTRRLAARQTATGGDTAAIVAMQGDMVADAKTGAWVTVQGTDLSVTPAASLSGLSYDQTGWRVQAGIDRVLYEGATGVWVAGVSLFQGAARTKVSAFAGDGEIASDAIGAGLTATWLGDTGRYVDIQLEYSHFDTHVSAARAARWPAVSKARVFLPRTRWEESFALQNGLGITPQAQLS